MGEWTQVVIGRFQRCKNSGLKIESPFSGTHAGYIAVYCIVKPEKFYVVVLFLSLLSLDYSDDFFN